jgi:hypothetical protein
VIGVEIGGAHLFAASDGDVGDIAVKLVYSDSSYAD